MRFLVHCLWRGSRAGVTPRRNSQSRHAASYDMCLVLHLLNKQQHQTEPPPRIRSERFSIQSLGNCQLGLCDAC
ncbi:hypothetical protein CKAH01_06907 [Colletotrichum kahawae]|uniref:Uncharacterized protein n=1 Tax=Colletotrichum kahawae TaxID=34407 RepID=A0AAE0D4K0_COLKA|nr:hypothetical protein CKAH01_06907 [Colletotrichum kahawae]